MFLGYEINSGKQKVTSNMVINSSYTQINIY